MSLSPAFVNTSLLLSLGFIAFAMYETIKHYDDSNNSSDTFGDTEPTCVDTMPVNCGEVPLYNILAIQFGMVDDADNAWFPNPFNKSGGREGTVGVCSDLPYGNEKETLTYLLQYKGIYDSSVAGEALDFMCLNNLTMNELPPKAPLTPALPPAFPPK